MWQRTNVDKAAVIREVCGLLIAGDKDGAAAIVQAKYPFRPIEKTPRSYTEYESMQVFVRDGFVDRYAGTRLVFPGTLRLLSLVLANEFPAHPNWKMSETHIAFWELFPTIDHLVPVARGGADEMSNWVCTSMLKNQAKSNWTVEELGWDLHDPGDISQWDGLTLWFLSYVASHQTLLNSGYLKRWQSAAKRCLPAG